MLIIFSCFLLTIIVYDIVFRRVPNCLLLAALLIHTAWLLFNGNGWNGVNVWQSLFGGLVGFALLIPLYALRAMGAGDVKFFTTLGFIMGPLYLVPLWLVGSVLAGVHALIWYAAKTHFAMASGIWVRLRDNVAGSAAYQTILKKRAGRHGIPYAAYLAMGALAIVMR